MNFSVHSCFLVFQSPAEKLDVACSSSSEFDIDKVILTLNPDSFKKEFFVEPGNDMNITCVCM